MGSVFRAALKKNTDARDVNELDELLTERFNGEMSLPSIEHLPIDVRNADTVTQYVTADHDVL
jgi:hypothetical protein